jgi:hypothetical protein
LCEGSWTNTSVLSLQTCDLTPFQIEDIRSQLGPSLVQEQQAAVLELINEFRDCFALNTKELGNANVKDMHIRLIDDVPVSYRPYRLAYSVRALVREIVEDLMDNGIIRESESPIPVLSYWLRRKQVNIGCVSTIGH